MCICALSSLLSVLGSSGEPLSSFFGMSVVCMVKSSSYSAFGANLSEFSAVLAYNILVLEYSPFRFDVRFLGCGVRILSNFTCIVYLSGSNELSVLLPIHFRTCEGNDLIIFHGIGVRYEVNLHSRVGECPQ